METLLIGTYPKIEHLEIKGIFEEAYSEILTPEALQFLIALHKQFNSRRKELLAVRTLRQKDLDAGKMPNFLEETAAIRASDWKVAPLPADLLDRRVEITGPVDRKMIINALNSGAKVFMADFEDSSTPTWKNVIEGQINLRDAVRREITFTNSKGKFYELKEQIATLLVRPRAWHLEEKHLLHEGEAMSGSLVDFGLYFFHNAKQLIANGSGPYFYLPKLESHLEARLWNDVFVFAQTYVGIPQRTIKATVLIETILASFELDEILYELRDHSAGLNCGRWDYIFSYIKKFSKHPRFTLPDRSKVGMTTPFMRAYSQLVIKTCHRRGVHAMGGMAAFIPIKNDEKANAAAINKVRQDKLLEVKNGHDGTWVAHPALVKVAMDIFDEQMPEKNQIQNKRLDFKTTAEELIAPVTDTITEAGMRLNIRVGILYMESWLRGHGAVAIYNLMEDAATAEISRAQLWQWIQHGAKLESGKAITYELYREMLPEELQEIKKYVGQDRFLSGKFEEATNLFEDLIRSKEFMTFLTIPAYNLI